MAVRSPSQRRGERDVPSLRTWSPETLRSSMLPTSPLRFHTASAQPRRSTSLQRRSTWSPKYQLQHYARMSAINLTTATHAQSHGSDHLSLVSSFGADNEGQKQFAKFQGRRWVSKRGPCLLELPWLAKSPRLIPAARVRLTNPRDLTDRPRRVRDLGLHMPRATHPAFRNWVDRA